MTTTTIDRIDHTNEQDIAALAEPVSRLVGAINTEYAQNPEGAGTALPASMSPDDVTALVRRVGERGGILYCRDDGDVVAFAMVQPDQSDEQTAVMGVWVRASHRRKGIGTELARAGAEVARDTGYAKLRGTIPSKNEPALSFFSAIGPIVQLESGGMGYELPV
ncbi:MAG: GNAT family N-acetyltransferase [Chloroflexi bacterium]|nr:GNAT family N-acetyltransferase [Chloroflexota bacterium]